MQSRKPHIALISSIRRESASDGASKHFSPLTSTIILTKDLNAMQIAVLEKLQSSRPNLKIFLSSEHRDQLQFESLDKYQVFQVCLPVLNQSVSLKVRSNVLK